MSTTSRTFRLAIPSILALATWSLMASAAWAQFDPAQERSQDPRDYSHYRSGSTQQPAPLTTPARPLTREEAIPRIRYDDRGLDDYWHDRMQQFRFQDWYGDNYRRYWPPAYRGQGNWRSGSGSPYTWWNDGYRRPDSGARTVRFEEFR